jgi:hypothetical protein
MEGLHTTKNTASAYFGTELISTYNFEIFYSPDPRRLREHAFVNSLITYQTKSEMVDIDKHKSRHERD